MAKPKRHDSSAITTWDVGISLESHVGTHAVVVAVGPGGAEDPSWQLITDKWAVTVQVARKCVGPTTGSALYGPSVVLLSVKDQTTGRKAQKLGTFPIERILRVMPVQEDDIDLKAQFTHIHDGDVGAIRMTMLAVAEVLFNLGKEATVDQPGAWATCRIAGQEVFAENGEWTDDRNNTLTKLPTVSF